MELLGVSWPLVAGWKASLIGKEIEDEAASEFIRLAGKHLEGSARSESSPEKKGATRAEQRSMENVQLNWMNAPEPVDIYLYVLELEDGCYYVGLTSDIQNRFQQHCSDDGGAFWTQMHKPRRLLHSINTGTRDTREALNLEDAATVTLMHQHGIAKVRGGRFSYVSQEQTEGALRAHGHWQSIKQQELDRQHFTLESSWSDALDKWLQLALKYHEAGAPKELVDALFTEGYKLTRYRYWHEDFIPGLSWKFWGRKGILPVLLSFKFGRPIGSRYATTFDVLAGVVNNRQSLRRLFLLVWQAFPQPISKKREITVRKFMGYLTNGEGHDRQYDAFVSVLMPETRYLLRTPG